MKTRIIICVSNRPDLLEKQIQLLNNFMIGEKVVSIVYDTRDKQYESFFKKICDDYNLEYHLHLSEPNCAPSFYHAQAATWAYQNVIKDEDVFAKAFCIICIAINPGTKNTVNLCPSTSVLSEPMAKLNTAKNNNKVTIGETMVCTHTLKNL